LVNPNTSGNNKEVNTNLDQLIVERKKTITHCLNLECKNEQLKILIEKLNNLASLRAKIISKDLNFKESCRDITNPYMEDVSILDELQNAKENSQVIEDTISELKNKILKIDQILSK
jgi:conjugal transfer/entry exclusion protein